MIKLKNKKPSLRKKDQRFRMLEKKMLRRRNIFIIIWPRKLHTHKTLMVLQQFEAITKAITKDQNQLKMRADFPRIRVDIYR